MKVPESKQDFLEWAKSKRPEDVLSHSSVDEPTIQKAVDTAYASRRFRKLHKEDNQWGLQSLKSAIAKRYGIVDSQDEPRVLLTPGASNAIFDVCDTFLNVDSEAIVEMPCYQPIRLAVEKTGAQMVPWNRDPDARFALDLAALPQLITHKTKLIVISNPHNPTSALATAADLLRLAQIVRDIAPANAIKIVVDEIFLDLTQDFKSKKDLAFADGTLCSVVRLGDEFISINGLSKVYGLSRLRCGWILGSPQVIENLRESYKIVINIGALDTEAVASILFKRIDNYAARSLSIVESNRKRLRSELTALSRLGILKGEVPDYGCICFPEIPWLSTLGESETEAIIDTLDTEFGVAPGRFFGSSERRQDDRYVHHVRVGFGGPRKLFRDKLSRFNTRLRALYSIAAPH